MLMTKQEIINKDRFSLQASIGMLLLDKERDFTKKAQKIGN